MTENYDLSKRHQTAKRACFTSFWVLMIMLLSGAFLFRFYGITIPAIKIAGGGLLFSVAVDMINARPPRSKSTDEEASEGQEKSDVAIFPLAIPLLSGPGSLASTLILAEKAQTLARYVWVTVAIAATLIVSLLILYQAGRLAKILGQIGINVFSRLMGLILAAISIQFVIDGIKGAFPSLL